MSLAFVNININEEMEKWPLNWPSTSKLGGSW